MQNTLSAGHLSQSEPAMLKAFMSLLKNLVTMKRRRKTARHSAAASSAGHRASTMVLQPAYTVRLKPEPDELPAAATHTTVSWCGLTDTGRVREHNEDAFASLPIGESILIVVADGMGGQDAGEVASRLAVEAVKSEAEHELRSMGDPAELLVRAVQRANTAVAKEGADKGSNLGTTLVAALVTQDRAHIANVGDSRAYWIENGSIRQITEDHSLVAKLVSAGRLTREAARNHPRANLLYRSIGSDGPVKVDAFQVELKQGGSLLLCTDGLWSELTEEEIRTTCGAERDVKAACSRLVEMANRNGGRDNITAVVVKIS